MRSSKDTWQDVDVWAAEYQRADRFEDVKKVDTVVFNQHEGTGYAFTEYGTQLRSAFFPTNSSTVRSIRLQTQHRNGSGVTGLPILVHPPEEGTHYVCRPQGSYWGDDRSIFGDLLIDKRTQWILSEIVIDNTEESLVGLEQFAFRLFFVPAKRSRNSVKTEPRSIFALLDEAHSTLTAIVPVPPPSSDREILMQRLLAAGEIPATVGGLQGPWGLPRIPMDSSATAMIDTIDHDTQSSPEGRIRRALTFGRRKPDTNAQDLKADTSHAATYSESSVPPTPTLVRSPRTNEWETPQTPESMDPPLSLTRLVAVMGDDSRNGSEHFEPAELSSALASLDFGERNKAVVKSSVEPPFSLYNH